MFKMYCDVFHTLYNSILSTMLYSTNSNSSVYYSNKSNYNINIINTYKSTLHRKFTILIYAARDHDSI